MNKKFQYFSLAAGVALSMGVIEAKPVKAVTISGMFTYQRITDKMETVKGSYTIDRTENGDFLGGSLDIGKDFFTTPLRLDEIVGDPKKPDSLINKKEDVKVNLGGGSVSLGSQVVGKNAPEPLTILGSVTLLGAGAALKREYSKQQKKAKSKT